MNPNDSRAAEYYKKSAAGKRKFNIRIMRTMMRKKHAEAEKRGLKKMTVTLILNPDTRMADIYVHKGFPEHMNWNASEGEYVGSYRYGS